MTLFPSTANVKNKKYHGTAGQTPLNEWRELRVIRGLIPYDGELSDVVDGLEGAREL